MGVIAESRIPGGEQTIPSAGSLARSLFRLLVRNRNTTDAEKPERRAPSGPVSQFFATRRGGARRSDHPVLVPWLKTRTPVCSKGDQVTRSSAVAVGVVVQAREKFGRELAALDEIANVAPDAFAVHAEFGGQMREVGALVG